MTDGDVVLPILISTVLGAFIAVAVMSIIATPNKVWRGQAIERGYALYCPDTGEFVWKGECDQ